MSWSGPTSGKCHSICGEAIGCVNCKRDADKLLLIVSGDFEICDDVVPCYMLPL